MNKSKYKILVTGSTGTIGSRIIDFLVEQKIFYIIGTTRSKNKSSNNPKIEYVTINEDINFDYTLICKNVDFIIHLAAINSELSLSDPINAFNVNCVSTGKLFKTALEFNVKKFIYFSTAHVYGNFIGNIDENTCTKCTHPYATSHRAAEDVISSLIPQDSIMNTIIFRLSNSFGVSGSKNNENLLIHDLVRNIVFNGTLPLKSKINTTRNFITLTDVCRAILHTIFVENENSLEIYNLGGEKSYTIYEIASLIQERFFKKFKIKSKIIFESEQFNIHESPNLTFNICKLKKSNFKLSSNFNEEIDNLLDFYYTLKLYESKI
jgi:UDP-glucose 4-epimerase